MATKIDYSFTVGKHFEKQQAKDAKAYLEAAEQIHAFLETRKVVTADGIYWQDEVSLLTPGKDVIDLSQYGGSSGALYFYLALYEVTGKELYKELVLQAADYLALHWVEQKATAKSSIDFEGIEYSIYTGVTGIGALLSKVYEVLPRQKDLDTIRAITKQTIEGAKKTPNGLSWGVDKSPLVGGGVVLYLYKIYALLKDEAVLAAANQGADVILSEAIADERGGYAWTSYAHPGQTRVPNFECGTAGVGYILGVAYEVSGDERYLNGAKEAAKHLKAIAIPQGDGFLVPWHDNPQEETIFYVSTCHGPAGTSRLFYQLYKATKDAQYLEEIAGLYAGLRHIGVPEKQSVGYWNNVAICCGTAGVAQFLINYQIVSGREDIKEVLDLAGSILLGQKEQQEQGIAWPLAFERVKPQNLSRGISYAAGASGIGAALLQIYLFLSDKYEWRRLFDDPYPVRA